MSLELLARADPGLLHFTRNENYYNGAKRLDALGVSLPPQVRLLELLPNWPKLAVDSLSERLTPTGFRLGDDQDTADYLFSAWQANGMDEKAPLGHTEAFVQGLAFGIVGPPRVKGGYPLITIHPRRGIRHRVDKGTGETLEALVKFQRDDGAWMRAYYTQTDVTYQVKTAGGWRNYLRTTHNAGICPVVPLVNRTRLAEWQGVSDMVPIMTITDAAARTLTNMQIAQELVALPQRYMFGVDETDFENAAGQKKPMWEVYIGRMLTSTSAEGNAGQFAGADLRQFLEIFNMYARLAASLTGLPPDFFGQSTQNPSSADAIRAGENRLVKRAELKQVIFGEAWERMMRLVLFFGGRGMLPASSRLETVWRNAATPTIGAVADAAVKYHQDGLLPPDMALEFAGFSPEQRKRAAALRTNPLLAEAGL